MIKSIAILVLMVQGLAAPIRVFPEGTTWQIAGTRTQTRWVEVHEAEGFAGGKLYHVEVLALKKGDARWHVLHIVPHMAITELALTRSVWRRSKAGGVYPETFAFGLAEWRRQKEAGLPSICELSVVECLHSAGR